MARGRDGMTRLAKRAIAALSLLCAGALPGAAAPAAAAPCPNEAIRVQLGATHLPDCRGYELVSPPDTNHNPVWAVTPSPDGERVAILYNGGMPGSPAGATTLLVAERTPGGWRSQSILPTGADLLTGKYQPLFATPGLTRFIAVAESSSLTGEPPNYLVRLDREGNQTLLHSFDATHADLVRQVAVSDDLDQVLVMTKQRLIDGHISGTRLVYDFGDSAPTPVSLLPDGSPPECGVPSSGSQQFNGSQDQHVISADGRRAYFHSSGDACGDPAELYMRDLEAETTTLVSGPPLAGPSGGAVFLRASADGSEAYFATTTRLDPADLNATRDIYRHTIGSGSVCMTCVVPEADVVEPTDSVQPVLSENGARVYFPTEKALTAADTDGTRSVYLLEGGELAYVAPLDGDIFDSLTPNSADGGQVTGDGRVLVFAASSPQLDALTGSSNAGFRQYYRYDAGDGSLVCISCPSGSAATEAVGMALAQRPFALATANPPILSEDGSLIAFKTKDKLVPEDVNGDEDVYRWLEGEVGLLTDGVTTYSTAHGDVAENQIFGVSSDGEDIFFGSYSRLIWDVPGSGQPTAQLYDARIGGGFPPLPPPPPPCLGEVCRGPAPASPPPPGLGSAALSGEGNLVGRGCRSRGRRAGRLARRAGKARRNARRLVRRDAKRTRQLRRKATRLARRSQKLRRQAKRCRAVERRAAR
ncbi:MAG: hypothetical protein WDZ46_06805 [Solirubrobacterales bacterium]